MGRTARDPWAESWSSPVRHASARSRERLSREASEPKAARREVSPVRMPSSSARWDSSSAGIASDEVSADCGGSPPARVSGAAVRVPPSCARCASDMGVGSSGSAGTARDWVAMRERAIKPMAVPVAVAIKGRRLRRGEEPRRLRVQFWIMGVGVRLGVLGGRKTWGPIPDWIGTQGARMATFRVLRGVSGETRGEVEPGGAKAAGFRGGMTGWRAGSPDVRELQSPPARSRWP
jgi:hypothetical protein